MKKMEKTEVCVTTAGVCNEHFWFGLMCPNLPWPSVACLGV